ncbi:MAG: DUF1538 family protein [Sulfurovum sp.]|nr:DUF1538 family protein [Sulfurovum sp.]
MNDKELLDYLKSTFEESKTLTEGSRKEGRDAYEYMRGNQLPADVIEALEDRGQPLMDGFGLIAFASVFPMITVMGYSILLDKK